MKIPQHKPPASPLSYIRYSGVHGGSALSAACAMPRPAIKSLIEDAQSRGVCIAVILADFYAQHHGEAQ